MLGKGMLADTDRILCPACASMSSAFPRYRRTIAFFALITLMGS
jgi:hypothetical protein